MGSGSWGHSVYFWGRGPAAAAPPVHSAGVPEDEAGSYVAKLGHQNSAGIWSLKRTSVERALEPRRYLGGLNPSVKRPMRALKGGWRHVCFSSWRGSTVWWWWCPPSWSETLPWDVLWNTARSSPALERSWARRGRTTSPEWRFPQRGEPPRLGP